MSHFFAGDGFDHYWTLAPGAVPSGNAALTVLALTRPTANITGPIRALKAGSASWSLHGDNPGKWYTDNDFSSGFTFSLNNWQMIGLTLPAGGGTVRWDGNFATGGVYGGWTTAAGPTIPAGAAPIDALTFGLSYSRMVGNIAAIAVYTGGLSSAAIAAIGTASGNAWMAASPAAYWQCNASPALGITDQTGHGANSISLTGTLPTLDTVNEPPGWTYYTASPGTNHGPDFFQLF